MMKSVPADIAAAIKSIIWKFRIAKKNFYKVSLKFMKILRNSLAGIALFVYSKDRMSDKVFTVLDLLDLELKGHDALNLKCLCGRRGLGRHITVPDINRPGLALSGFYDVFAWQRVQLFGHGEWAYLQKMYGEGNVTTVRNMLSYRMPCCIFSSSLVPPREFIDWAEECQCPVLQSDLESTDLSNRLIRLLSNVFAPKKTMHGVLLEIYGLGTLLTGNSGIGKSETALELIERGHRLVADDIVEIRCVNGNTLMGQGANAMLSHHMEIRGIGIINVSQLYGVGAIREQKELQLVVNLATWDSAKVYDRLGTDDVMVELLGVKVPSLEIPVKPGRNLPIIIEAAAMNERNKAMGYFSAREFNRNILKWIETGEAKKYYGGDDTY